MGSLRIYDIAANDIIVGAIPVKDAIVSAEIAAEGDAFADEAGADGTVIRYATHENRATCTIVLKGSSEENAKLSALHALDKAASNGAGVVPFLIRDNNGTTLISTDKAWIRSMATKTLAAAPGDTTWQIRLVLDSPLSWVVGGN
jgi:hypothetical protein